jgi:hypothetical protein
MFEAKAKALAEDDESFVSLRVEETRSRGEEGRSL